MDDLEEEPAAEDPFAPAPVSDDEDDEDDEDESGSEDEDGEAKFDAMLADGPQGSDDDEDLDSFLDDDD